MDLEWALAHTAHTIVSTDTMDSEITGTILTDTTLMDIIHTDTILTVPTTLMGMDIIRMVTGWDLEVMVTAMVGMETAGIIQVVDGGLLREMERLQM